MRELIDFHTHILPNVDDGSKNVDTSVKMIELLAKQKVKTVVATPHFNANKKSISDFLEERNASYNELSNVLPTYAPDILLGAEVEYYEGISRLDSISKLRIEKSNLLLIEMPLSMWSEYVLKEILELSCSSGITVVIAHLERYMKFQTTQTLECLRKNGVLMQVNADYFNGFFTKNKASSLLINGMVHFIGSDCHDLKKRAPNISKAYKTIENKTNSQFIESYCKYINSFFKQD